MLERTDVANLLRISTLMTDQVAVPRSTMLELADQCADHPLANYVRTECQDERWTFLLLQSASVRELCRSWLEQPV